MKHKITFLAVMMMAMAMPKVANAYDFSYMLPNGIDLYFNIVNGHAVVTYPGYENCYYCNGWEPWGGITIPDSVTYNGTCYAVTAIGDHAFYMCDELTSITLPSHITQIYDWAFYDCSALSSVSLPSSLVSIGSQAFGECSSLASIVIPNNVAYIGNGAFSMCSTLSSVTLGNSVATIDTGAFSSCYNLHTISFPNSLTTIGFLAFYATGLSSISFGNAVTTIGESAFGLCALYNPVTIPSTVTSIGENAFSSARMLYYEGTATGSPWGAFCVNGYIEDSLYYTSAAKDTLTGAMREITAADIPNTVNVIGRAAFMGCSDMISVTIPNSVVAIGQESFEGCHGLSAVNIPASVDTIGILAFNYCMGLRNITFEGTNPPAGDDFFYYLDTIHIPCGTLAAYSAAIPGVSYFVMPDFSYQFSAATEDESKGTVTVTTAPTCDTPAVVSATVSGGYQFSHWSNGSHENPISISVYQDTTIIAYFEIAPVEPVIIYIHDTISIHDTTIVTDTVTLTEYITQTDTVTLAEYVTVHDTTYITQIVHDTTVVMDTVTLTEYVPVHDTTYIDVLVHDTTYVTLTDTVINTVYDTVDNYIYDTVNLTDTLWLTQTDTLWLHDTIIIHDTIYISQEGIDGVDALNAKVYSSQGQVVVEGADGKFVTLFDINGRMIATRREYDTAIRFDVPSSGTYMIKIGSQAAKKVVVIR